MIIIENYVILNLILFLIGIFGIVLNRKNVLMILLSIEILTLAICLNFCLFSIFLDDILGQLIIVFILSIAAAESAIGLSLILTLYKLKKNL